MPNLKKLSRALSVALVGACATVAPAVGQEAAPPYYPWMHPEVPLAWAESLGAGVTITVIDNFTGTTTYTGNLDGGGTETLRHGEWTLKEASMIAPSSTMVAHDFYSGRAVSLTSGFDVLNLSYGMVDRRGLKTINWGPQERSIIDAAHGNLAFVSKAAGNDYGTAVGQPNLFGKVDYLARDLIGAQGAVFVGALEENGSVDDPARIASYSNVAGKDTRVQEQFLVVGVESGITGLQGTSFAAPIVSGYAGLVSSKFNTESPSRIADRLLDTARTDTIQNYSLRVHGQGEADVWRALAPDGIR